MIDSSFEWDEAKNLSNQENHGVSFDEAQHAFLDESRIIAEDAAHSKDESRYFCFGFDKDHTGILTVRFTYRNSCIRIFACGLLEKGEENL